MLVPTDKHWFEPASLRQDSTARLLLLVARTHLNEEQKSDVAALAADIGDWTEFARIAAQKFVATYAHRHLRDAASSVAPAGALNLLRRYAYSGIMASLRVAAAQLAFHKACIVSTGASHAYLKGPALAAQSGQEIGDRPCRDVDVLVSPKHFRRVLDAAGDAGYAVYLDYANAKRATNNRDMDFLARYPDVVTVVGQDSIPIEVHHRLDKGNVGFDVAAALRNVETVRISGQAVDTLSRPLHFNYLCYHHARHFWSKLHWVVDLVEMAETGLDKAEVLRMADDIGIRPTVDAALCFSVLVSKPGPWDSATVEGTSGGQFLGACLLNLDGDIELERELRNEMLFDDFISAWQISSGRKREFQMRALMKRLRPATGQHLRRRLPLAFHWLYVLRNAAAIAREMAASRPHAHAATEAAARR